MPRFRYRGDDDRPGREPRALPFPHAPSESEAEPEHPAAAGDGLEAGGDHSMSHVLDALDSVSRRMEDLARALGCLGFFDDDDRPRAA